MPNHDEDEKVSSLSDHYFQPTDKHSVSAT